MTPSTPPIATPPASPVALVGEPLTGEICAACPHPVAAHDPIGQRFCSASVLGGMSRGCICSH